MCEETTYNVICLKWGTLYPAAYTNTLYRSVKKHLHRPFRFVCVTDNPEGLDEGIDAQPFPPNPDPSGKGRWPDIFAKLAILQDGFAQLKGPTLFMDVDVVIMDDIDCFFDYKPGENCIIHNWIEWHKTVFRKRPDIGNSSIFRFEAGKSGYIYDTFIKEFDDAHDRSKFTTEQAFLTYAMKKVNWWPSDWALSFKRSCRPIFPLNLFVAPKPPKTKILVFHGSPNPDQAVIGFDDGKVHHKVLPAPWIEDYWKLDSNA